MTICLKFGCSITDEVREGKFGGPSTSLYLNGRLGDCQIFAITSNAMTNIHMYIFLCSCERVSLGEYVVGNLNVQLY